jgi:hypothetical protein
MKVLFVCLLAIEVTTLGVCGCWRAMLRTHSDTYNTWYFIACIGQIGQVDLARKNILKPIVHDGLCKSDQFNIHAHSRLLAQ